jgi:hypothetical protein
MNEYVQTFGNNERSYIVMNRPTVGGLMDKLKIAKDLSQVLQDVVCMLCNLLASCPSWRNIFVCKTILTTTMLNRPSEEFVISQLYK